MRRPTSIRRLRPLVLAFLLGVPVASLAEAGESCVPTERAGTVEGLVAKIQNDDLRYVFVGEQHDIGPVKRFAVELANALTAAGSEVGLYVEGFRTTCPPGDWSCPSLADAFNVDAFEQVLQRSAAPVHALDPPERDRRAERMAATIAAGPEAVRVVLVGKSHVIYAGDPDAELWIFGGGMKFPDPGDLAEAFPPEQILTIGLETSRDASLDTAEPYSIAESGCGLDFVVTTAQTTDYWGDAPSSDLLGSGDHEDRSTLGVVAP